MIETTRTLAYHWHRGQLRKYTGLPYTTHLETVFHLVKSVSHDDFMLCAALLHDVLEDTECTRNYIVAACGEDVACLVSELTDISKKEDGNRAARKKIDREHAAVASPRAQTIKIADIISNIRDVEKHDPEFAKVYLPEKRLVLDVLTAGDRTLWNIANELLTAKGY